MKFLFDEKVERIKSPSEFKRVKLYEKFDFISNIKLDKKSFGKIIFSKEENKVILFGNTATISEEIPIINLNDFERAFFFFENIRNTIEINVGFHNDIDSYGKVIGGTHYVSNETDIYFFFKSVSYGPISEEIIRRCTLDIPLKKHFFKLDSNE